MKHINSTKLIILCVIVITHLITVRYVYVSFNSELDLALSGELIFGITILAANVYASISSLFAWFVFYAINTFGSNSKFINSNLLKEALFYGVWLSIIVGLFS